MVSSAACQPQKRVLSLDILRGLTVLLMLFVNEMAGVSGTPAWLRHVPRGGDGMTIVDVVFPAFLFMVGMSIPFALDRRLAGGARMRGTWSHILTRSLSLLTIGVLMVNADSADPGGLLDPRCWNVLMTLGVILAWLVPSATHPARGRALRAIGVAVLLGLVLVYRGQGVSGAIQIRTQWWGILGLIGWAYLIAASTYLLLRERAAGLVGVVALLYCLDLADQAGNLWFLVALRPVFNIGPFWGSHSAIVLSGVILSLWLRRALRGDRPASPMVPAALFAVGLWTAGVLLHTLRALHPVFTISKPLATPSWCLTSSAFTAGAWIAVYWIADIRGFRRWPRSFAMAGENALLAYLLAPCLISLFELTNGFFGGGNPYRWLGADPWIGAARSAVFAWAVVRLTGLMRNQGIRVRL